jgi:hypothetical protein
MNMRSIATKLALTLLLCCAGSTQAQLIGGVEFPDGPISFADAVVSYTPGADVGAGWNDPTAALGIPDYNGSGAVSLGDLGELILQFTDNSLTTSGTSAADLWIFEIGAAVEVFNVAISTNLSSWIDLGNVLGQPTGIDIDAVAGVTAGTLYSYVRLRDVLPNQSNAPFGEADIDAVGAISSGAPAPVPAPSVLALLLLAVGVISLRHRRST